MRHILSHTGLTALQECYQSTVLAAILDVLLFPLAPVVSCRPERVMKPHALPAAL